MKLLEHLRAMQGMATRYLIPEPYVDRDGQSSKVALGTDTAVRNNLFVGDMIYMLDGPEQRAAQEEAEYLATPHQDFPQVSESQRPFDTRSVNEGLRLARLCNGQALPGDLPEDQVAVRFGLREGVTKEAFVASLVEMMNEEGLSYLGEALAELEVDRVVHVNA